MGFRYPPYGISNLSKLGVPSKVSFKKGESMVVQKAGGGRGFVQNSLMVSSVAVVLAVF
jgi:hypothetical protein